MVALPEEDTIFVNGDRAVVIGSRPYYIFKNGEDFQHDVEGFECNLELD